MKKWIKRYWTFDFLIICVVGWGCYLRIFQYLWNRTLWFDEANLALNVAHRSFLDYLTPLNPAQNCPVGFLYLVEVFDLFFGHSDYILRIVPLLSGILSLFLFCCLINYFVKSKAKIVGIFCFAVSYKLIYFSTEFKQYSTEVLVAVILMLLAFHIFETSLKSKRFILFTVFVGFSIWFSYSSVFVVGSIFLVLAIKFLKEKKFDELFNLFLSGLFLLVNFFFLYKLLIHHSLEAHSLDVFWEQYGAFPPLMPNTKYEWLHWWGLIKFYFNFTNGIYACTVALFVLTVGCISFVHKGKWKELLLCIVPFFLTLLAAVFKKYPFYDRLVLFTLPFLFILFSSGFDCLFSFRRKWIRVFSLLVCIVVFSYSFFTAIVYSSKSITYFESRSMFKIMEENLEPGDVIFGSQKFYQVFLYYAPFYNLNNYKYVAYQDNADGLQRNEIRKEIEQLKNCKRVWFVASKFNGYNTDTLEGYIQRQFRSLGVEQVISIDNGHFFCLYRINRDLD